MRDRIPRVGRCAGVTLVASAFHPGDQLESRLPDWRVRMHGRVSIRRSEEIVHVDRFTLSGALQAAQTGSIEAWVQDYLRGPGNNTPFADGLLKQQRWWIGPAAVPASELTRIVGPELGMPWPAPVLQFEARLAGLAAHMASTASGMPVLMANGDEATLPLNDGNHRYEVLRRGGQQQMWTLVWFSDEASWRSFARPWADRALRTVGAAEPASASNDVASRPVRHETHSRSVGSKPGR